MTEPKTPRPLDIREFERLPFSVQAVEVTRENIKQVARWCGGQVKSEGRRGNKKYIEVDVKRALNDRQKQAYVGDWVLRAGSGYKIYTPRVFAASFREKVEHMVEVVDNQIKREEAENKAEEDQFNSKTPDELPTGGMNTSFLSASQN